MTHTLDPAVLEAITQEARQCFLEEDAPEYLGMLRQGLILVEQGAAPDYKVLMRAAHSVKGGAGVAQMPQLSALAHRIEDLLEAWNRNEIEDTESAALLMQQGIEELAYMLDAARSSQGDVSANPNLVAALEDFLASLKSAEEEATVPKEITPARLKLAIAALQNDLESCLTTFETLLKTSADDAAVNAGIATLADECLLLGDAYDLPWLVKIVEPIALECAQLPPPQFSRDLAASLAAKLRSERDHALETLQHRLVPPATSATPTPDQGTATLNGMNGINNPVSQAPEAAAPDLERVQHLRIPLERVERMGSLIGELITAHERLTIQQQQLRRSSLNLRRLVEQVKPVRDAIQTLYDRVSTEEAAIDTVADGTEFDALEMDRYTALHSSLQTFEELITQVQETRIDIDLVSREFSQNLTDVRVDLDLLYNDITNSRLVPFQSFAQRFLPQLNRINQRVGKKSTLMITGEDVLIDKILLEQLQTPLTHILNNALDHGIEAPGERLAVDKPETATIRLSAHIEGSEVAITIQDDGRGIDLRMIYQKAVERGLCPAHVPMTQLSREHILDFIWQPGFSTAAQVSDISGRGVGMDIVRTLVRQLRGTVEVDTQPGQGTVFTIRLPLSLSLLSLLLCQVGQRTIAIPTDTILDILPYEDAIGIGSVPGLGKVTDERSMTWRGQVLPLYPLARMLPYADRSARSTTPRVVLIVKQVGEPIAVMIDGIVDERQLILRPFDDTVHIPPYIAGCTILGTGEVVPVVIPRFLKLLRDDQQAPLATTISQSSRTVLIAEDSTGARRSLERILTHSGFTTIACRDGQEAISKLEQHQGLVDLIISDVEMPLVNGFELLSKVRTHSLWHALPVIMLTSRTGDRHRQKAMSLGANDYLGKPVTPAELMASISQLIRVN